MSGLLAGALRRIRGLLVGVSPEEIRYTFEDVRAELRAARAELKAEIAALRADLERLAPDGAASRAPEEEATPPPPPAELPERAAGAPGQRRQPRTRSRGGGRAR